MIMFCIFLCVEHFLYLFIVEYYCESSYNIHKLHYYCISQLACYGATISYSVLWIPSFSSLTTRQTLASFFPKDGVWDILNRMCGQGEGGVHRNSDPKILDCWGNIATFAILILIHYF